MQLVGVEFRRGTALQVGHVGALLRDNQRALELTRLLGVDAEIRRQIHRAPHALGDVTKRAVGEHRRIEGGVEIVAGRHHGPEIHLHKLRMVFDRLGKRTEDDADFGQFPLVRSGDRHAVKNDIHGDPGKCLALVHRHAQLLKSAQQLRIHFVHGRELLWLRRGEIADVLEVDLRVRDVRPGGFPHRQPVAVRLQPELEQPFRFAFLRRNQAYDVLAQSLRHDIRLDVGNEPVLVGLIDQFLNDRTH